MFEGSKIKGGWHVDLVRISTPLLLSLFLLQDKKIMGPEVLEYMSSIEIISLAHEAFEDLLPQESELSITVAGSGDNGKCLHFYVRGEENATILREAIPSRYSGLDTIVIYTYDGER